MSSLQERSASSMEGLSACECPVCLIQLSADKRPPLSLPCGHTICKPCVSELAKPNFTLSAPVRMSDDPERRQFRCPLCRKLITFGEVRLNVTLRDLLIELHRMNQRTGVTSYDVSLNTDYSEIQFTELLDRGAFAEVYKGRWRSCDVAVKVFAVGTHLSPETKKSFQHEVYVMSCLRHPNIVLLMGACQALPRLAILMEYMAGGCLYGLLHTDKVRLSLDQIQSIGLDMCRGLQYLHSINILHRDLKSKNVLLTGELPCSAKLCDFGLSRVRRESATMTGLIGTTHWTSPEVMNNRQYHFPADIYGLGMVLYEMACGKIPFHDMNPTAVILAVAVHKKKPELPPDTNKRLSELIFQCAEWEPSNRPSLSVVLSVLANLVPIVLKRSLSQAEREKRIKDHHDQSLGVVFVTANSEEVKEQQPQVQFFIRQATEEVERMNLELSDRVDAPEDLPEASNLVTSSPKASHLAPPGNSHDSDPTPKAANRLSPSPILMSDESPNLTPNKSPLEISPEDSDEEDSHFRRNFIDLGQLSPRLQEIAAMKDEGEEEEEEVGEEEVAGLKLQAIQKAFFDAVKRGNLDRVKQYHRMGAELTAKDSTGWTPLHHAARLGKKKVVEYLAINLPREGLDIIEMDKQQSALHKAAWFGYRSICRILVEHGASLTIRDYQGYTPYVRSIQSEDRDLQKYLKRKESLQVPQQQ